MPLRQEEYFWEEEVVAQQPTKTKVKPKKKSKKHIQIINKVDEIIQNKLETKQIIYNEDIKRAIKLYWR